MQNIPSHEKTIRMLFCAKNEQSEIEPENSCYRVPKWTSVETTDGFKVAHKLTTNDILIVDENDHLSISNIEYEGTDVLIYIAE